MRGFRSEAINKSKHAGLKFVSGSHYIHNEVKWKIRPQGIKKWEDSKWVSVHASDVPIEVFAAWESMQ